MAPSGRSSNQFTLARHAVDALRDLEISDDAARWHVRGIIVTGFPVMAPYIRDLAFDVVSIADLRQWMSRAGRDRSMRAPKKRRARKH
jgi:hypothetical protein